MSEADRYVRYPAPISGRRRYSRRNTPELKAAVRVLEMEHAILNGERIHYPVFERHYRMFRTHMLNEMENFYEDKMMAGFLTLEAVIARITEKRAMDAEGPKDPETLIKLRQVDVDHLIAHLTAWSVRESRMANYQRAGRHADARSLEDIYDSMSPRKRDARKAYLTAVGEDFPAD